MKVIYTLKGWTARYCLIAFLGLSTVFSFSSSSSAEETQAVAVLNAASFASDSLVAPNTIVAAFGAFKTLNNQIYPAQGLPLPTTLGGVRVSVNGTNAALFIVTPGQINLVIPLNAALGNATVVVTNSDGTTVSGNCTIVQSAPGVFTATSNGMGVAAAETTFDGITYEFVVNPDLSPKAVNPGTETRPNFLIVYATGLGSVQLAQVKVTFLGLPGRVDYAGPQGAFTGLDQLNVRIPWEMGGLGTVRILVTVTIGQTEDSSNAVTINLGGEIPDIVAQPISNNEVVTGALTYDDQIQTAGDNIYFIDAYIFQTTVPNVSLAIDLRSPRSGAAEGEPAFDAQVLLYHVLPDRTDLIAVNDQTGGIGNGQVDVNNNALLLTVVPDVGTYLILASSSDLRPLEVGTYTLSFKSGVIPQLTYGQTVNGEITTSDVKTSADVFIDAYWFNATQGDRIQATMRSTAFDSALFLYRNNADPEIAFNDNGGGGLDAQLTFLITQTGRYLIFATPFAANKTGAYTLSLTRLSSFGPTEAAAENTLNADPGRFDPVMRNIRRFGDPYPPEDVVFDRAARRRFRKR